MKGDEIVMNMKALKVIQGVVTIAGLALSVVGTVIGGKIQKAENLEEIARLIKENK